MPTDVQHLHGAEAHTILEREKCYLWKKFLRLAGDVSRQHGTADVSDCLSYKSWRCEGVHMRQMFLLFRGLQIFRLERKERRKGEK